MTTERTPPKKKARELAKYFRAERADYSYLKSVFRALREELEIQVPRSTTRLPEVPTEEELRRFYQAVWNCRNLADMVLIKTLFYTGVRVSELVAIRLDEVDVERCQIRITQGKGHKDRQVPFPLSFRELLALLMKGMREKGAIYPFESSRKDKYTDRGARKMLARYAQAAGIPVPCPLTSGGISCSPGSKSRASMMPSSNRTPAMRVGSRWRSIPNCHWPTRNKSTIRPWGASLFNTRAGVLCIPALVYLISYFAAGDSLRSDTPYCPDPRTPYTIG